MMAFLPSLTRRQLVTLLLAVWVSWNHIMKTVSTITKILLRDQILMVANCKDDDEEEEVMPLRRAKRFFLLKSLLKMSEKFGNDFSDHPSTAVPSPPVTIPLCAANYYPPSSTTISPVPPPPPVYYDEPLVRSPETTPKYVIEGPPPFDDHVVFPP